MYMNAIFDIIVKWTKPAEEQVEQMDPRRFNGDAKRWHEDKVKEHAERTVPQATSARIRKPAHVGGMDPNEPEHITVTYKFNNRDLGAYHVYTSTLPGEGADAQLGRRVGREVSSGSVSYTPSGTLRL